MKEKRISTTQHNRGMSKTGKLNTRVAEQKQAEDRTLHMTGFMADRSAVWILVYSPIENRALIRKDRFIC